MSLKADKQAQVDAVRAAAAGSGEADPELQALLRPIRVVSLSCMDFDIDHDPSSPTNGQPLMLGKRHRSSRQTPGGWAAGIAELQLAPI